MIPFTKMHGIGNDFVFIDAIERDYSNVDWSGASQQICDRKLGIGSDGLILLSRGDTHPLKMVMINPDGSESEMCGNGIRCLAVLAKAKGYLSADSTVCETGAGDRELILLGDGRVRVGMGAAHFDRGHVGFSADSDELRDVSIEVEGTRFVGTAVSTGNPHFVMFVDDAQSVELLRFGPLIEHLDLFTHRTNVHFATANSRQRITQRTWERGAGATLACGTGACACTAAGVRTGRLDRNVVVSLPGGELEVEYDETGHLWMTGPTETVFEGAYNLKLPIS